jgi:hypothetical protein
MQMGPPLINESSDFWTLTLEIREIEMAYLVAYHTYKHTAFTVLDRYDILYAGHESDTCVDF